MNDPANDLRRVAAGCLWIAFLFAFLLTLPRTFLQEEEGGTADLLKLVARPHAVWWGKLLFNLGQALALAALTTGLFLALVGPTVTRPGMFIVGIFGGTAAIAATVTLCGAIAATAAGRATLAATLAVPLLLGVMQQAVAATSSAFGAGGASLGWPAALGLTAFAFAASLVGPSILATTWRN